MPTLSIEKYLPKVRYKETTIALHAKSVQMMKSIKRSKQRHSRTFSNNFYNLLFYCLLYYKNLI